MSGLDSLLKIILDIEHEKINILVNDITEPVKGCGQGNFLVWKPDNKYIPESIFFHGKTA